MVTRLCTVLVCAAVFYFFAVPVAAENSPEFAEYEMIVLAPLSDPADPSIPDWRTLYLEKIAKYEAYLKKYPNSPLVAEVKLRIAELAKDVERPEIYPLRVKMYECVSRFQGDSETQARMRVACIQDYWEKSKERRDPVYTKKAVRLLLELVEKYGHQKRYDMQEPRLGGFRWVEEEIGARALYLLSQGVDPAARKRLLLNILKEYKIGPQLAREIKEDLEKLKNAQ